MANLELLPELPKFLALAEIDRHLVVMVEHPNRPARRHKIVVEEVASAALVALVALVAPELMSVQEPVEAPGLCRRLVSSL